MPAIHLFLGLPLVLVPIGFHCNALRRRCDYMTINTDTAGKERFFNSYTFGKNGGCKLDRR
jgi:hypothetical protein